MSDNFRECRHPLIVHKLSYLRQPREIVKFREYERLIYEIAILLGYEATRDLELKPIDTSRKAGDSYWRAGDAIHNKPIIVPIVRSGLIMASALRSIIPTPYMGHIGISEDIYAQTPDEFMVMMPEDMKDRLFIIADMFIDRGKTASLAIDILMQFGVHPSQVIFISLIASHKGKTEILKIPANHYVRFYCGLLDHENEEYQILPDFKETNYRLFRTKKTQ